MKPVSDIDFVKAALDLGEMDEETATQCRRAIKRARDRGEETPVFVIAEKKGLIRNSGRKRVLLALRELDGGAGGRSPPRDDEASRPARTGSRSDSKGKTKARKIRTDRSLAARAGRLGAPRRSNLLPMALAVGVLVGGGVGLGIYVAMRPKDDGAKPERAVASPSPEGTVKTSTPRSDAPAPAPEKPAAGGGEAARSDAAVEKAAAAVVRAEKIEREGREREALALIDAAIAEQHEEPAQKILADVKAKVLLRTAEKLDKDRVEVKRLAQAGENDEARKLVARMRKRFPTSLEARIAEAEKDIDAAIAERTAREAEEKKAAEAKAKHDAEAGRYATLRGSVDKALGALDPVSAKTALDGEAAFEEKELQDEVALDRKRVAAIETLIGFASEAYKADIGSDLDLAMRKGPRLKGKLLRVDGDKLAISAMGGEMIVGLGEIAPAPVLLWARRAARKRTDEYAWGRGVLLACVGDRKGAIEALDQAASIAEAEALKKRIKSQDEGGAEVAGVVEKKGPTAKPSKGAPPAPAPAPSPKPGTDEPTPPAANGEDEQAERTLRGKLHVPVTVKGGVASFEYTFTGEDQLQDWKQKGFDLLQCGSHEVVNRAFEQGLLVGASSRGYGAATQALKLKGDYEIEVRMMFNQMSPSGDFIVFFGEKNGKSTGVSYGQQLVKIGSSGVKPLSGPSPNLEKWASERVCTFKIVRKGDMVDVIFNGVKTAQAKGEFDGKIGIMGLGIRAVIGSFKVRGSIDPSEL